MAAATKVSGSSIKLVEKGRFSTLMETLMRESGPITKLTEGESTSTCEMRGTKANGRTIFSTAKVMKLGLRELRSKATT